MCFICVHVTMLMHCAGMARRCVIADAAFSGYKLAVALLEKGLYHIGNVKTCHSGFPKAKLQAMAPLRDMVSMATTSVQLADGRTYTILATSDRDKQPMSLISTAGTSQGPAIIERRVRTIHKDGRAKVSTKTLQTVMVGKKYRECFNVIDKHNAKRQGGACLEDIWRTHRWVLRDYQALVGVSLINTLLAVRHFKRLQLPYWKFLRVMYTQCLENSVYLSRRRRRDQAAAGIPRITLQHKLLSTKQVCGRTVQRLCHQCGERRTMWFCACHGPPSLGTPTDKHYKDSCVFICSTVQHPECFARHVRGDKTSRQLAIADKLALMKRQREANVPLVTATPAPSRAGEAGQAAESHAGASAT